MDFNTTLYTIDSNLTQEDLECLKFLCVDIIPSKRLVSIKSNLDLFEELQKRNRIEEDNVFLLAELLYIIGQHSLLKLLNTNRMIMQETLKSEKTISLYRRMLFELYEDITKEDLKHIIFLLKLPSKFKENKNFLDILCYLEKSGLLSKNSLEVLENVLPNVAPDLLKTINNYKKEKELQRAIMPSIPSEEEFQDVLKPPLSVQVVTSPVSSTDKEFPNDDTEIEHIQEVSGPANEGGLKAGDTGIHMSALSLNEQPTSEAYVMNRKHRGYCLIINNSEFKKSDPRPGTEKDAEVLKNVFNWLELDVETLNELTTEGIHMCMKDFQTRDHNERDCFVCCILTHGKSRAVLGTDNGVIPIEDIISYFSARNCITLAGKPKLFFIQACQGTDTQSASCIEADAISSVEEKKSSPTIPNDADFLLGMSTVDGYYSFRHIRNGTWYIQALCENLMKMVPKGEDILSILTKVNKDVSEMEHSKDGLTTMKQMPQPAYTLRKKLVFPIPLVPYKPRIQTNFSGDILQQTDV